MTYQSVTCQEFVQDLPIGVCSVLFIAVYQKLFIRSSFIHLLPKVRYQELKVTYELEAEPDVSHLFYVIFLPLVCLSFFSSDF